MGFSTGEIKVGSGQRDTFFLISEERSLLILFEIFLFHLFLKVIFITSKVFQAIGTP